MSVWSTIAVEQQPDVFLEQWQVFELPNGDRHFCGYEHAYKQGRVSSLVVSYDPKLQQGVTQSGRCYSLCGPPSQSSDALYVWSVWKAINGIVDYQDVSHKV